MCFLQYFRDLVRTEVWPLRAAVPEVLFHHPSSVGSLLKDQESCRPLYICEGFRIRALQEVVPGATYYCEPEITDEFFEVVLTDAEEHNNIPTEVVDYLDLRFRFAEEHLSSAQKWLRVARVFGDQWDDSSSGAVFTTNIDKWRNQESRELMMKST